MPGGPSSTPDTSLPCFFLGEAPTGRTARLLPGESEHALRVLRMKPGDRCQAVDGQGRRWLLRIVAAGSRELGLEVLGPPEVTPAPGEAGAPLPWIEVAVAWPKKNRAEEMIGRLVQLGVAAITPLRARQGGPAACPDEPPERWWKIAREAVKQCGRSWLPVFHPPLFPAALAERAEGVFAMFDPRHGMSLDTWLRSLRPSPLGVGTREEPIVLVVGPEGGFDREETGLLLERGATCVRLTPHVLRIETAAEAALAVAGTVLSFV